MALINTRSRRTTVLAGAVSVALLASACGGGSSTTASAGGGGSTDCAAYTQYGDLSGKTISVYTGIVTPEDTAYKDSYKPFTDCTHATVTYEGDKSFETQILVRAKAGNPPDIAIVPQPGLVKQLVATGTAKVAPAAVAANVDKFWSPEWKAYTTVAASTTAHPRGRT
jgi:alpha-glucoside transport system substrate-binding protein